MQASNGKIIATIIVCALLVIGSFYFMIPDVPEFIVPTATEIAAAITIPAVPTAAEISAGIVVPAAAEGADSQRVQELWDREYSEEINVLESQAEALCIEEFLDDNKDFEDDGYGEFGEDDEVAELFEEDAEVVFLKEYDDDREITITNLGLDDVDGEEGDDRAVTVTSVIKVEVEPDMGDDYKDRVYLTCEVTSDDGDLEADVSYSLEA